MNRRFTRAAAWLAGIICAALTATACSGTTEAPKGKSGGTLNVVSLTAPSTLNPARASINVGDNYYVPLAYDSLIRLGPKGKFVPGLATSWKYVGEGNREFQLTIRKGVKFADGTPVTVDAVVKSLKFTFADPASPVAPTVGKVNSVEASGADTVTIKLAESNPSLEWILSSTAHTSSVISAKGLANSKALGHRTFGAGPYVLDEKATVSNDHYTYTPNPHYYNKSAIRYAKIVIKVVSSPNAALSLLKTGAADVAQGDVNTVQSAKSANLKTYSTLVAQTGIMLTDKAATGAKPLSNKLVRQALNHAIDRKTIVEGLLHGTGKPVNQVGTPGTPDYLDSEADRYAYDPEKAKSLLAQAGYPNGFRASMVVFNANPPTGDVAQAVVSDWAKIGVKVDVVNAADGAKYQAEYLSKKHAFVSYGYGYQPFFLYAKSFYLPAPGVIYSVDDPELKSLVKRSDAAAPAEQQSLRDQATRRAVDLSWTVPVTSFSVFYYTSPKVKGVDVDLKRPLLDLTELSPA
ncbi:ABC transporter substrate-binding protein [Streptomyces sp. NPDC047939]|uniref:ABC transporter substrate-binding protein n=1 Tax=Streptomyces sp. NPDC047939 TaxID=3155381 RepID=UPI003414A8F5